MSVSIVLALSLSSSPALPCVNLVHEPGELAESDGEESIFWRDEAAGEAVVEYLVRYWGDTADFGWIIPIPAAFVSLDESDEERFTHLREQTTPDVWYVTTGDDDEDGGGIGCGCAGGAKNQAGGLGEDRALGDTGGAGLEVDVVAQGFAGEYEYTVVASESAEDLQAWLEVEGWTVGDTAPSIDQYVSEGFQFVLVKLASTISPTPDEAHALPPIAIRYQGDALTFPARMARYAGAARFRTTVYVIGDQAASVSGWSSQDVGWLEGNAEDGPNAVFDAALESAGQATAFARVHAGPTDYGAFDGQWVTRFDTLARAEVHTVDAVFAPDDGIHGTHCTIELWGDPPEQGWLVFPLVALAALGWGLRRRDVR